MIWVSIHHVGQAAAAIWQKSDGGSDSDTYRLYEHSTYFSEYSAACRRQSERDLHGTTELAQDSLRVSRAS